VTAIVPNPEKIEARDGLTAKAGDVYDTSSLATLFRLGNDQLLVDATGQSKISVQDYAVAMIDELERPAHVGRRFTAGY